MMSVSLHKIDDIAHFHLYSNVKPTAEDIRFKSLALSELKGYVETLNSFFELLCFGHQRAVLPWDYYSSANIPSDIDGGTDIDRLLNNVARESGYLDLPEENPQLWSAMREKLSEAHLAVLNQFRARFGIDPAE